MNIHLVTVTSTHPNSSVTTLPSHLLSSHFTPPFPCTLLHSSIALYTLRQVKTLRNAFVVSVPDLATVSGCEQGAVKTGIQSSWKFLLPTHQQFLNSQLYMFYCNSCTPFRTHRLLAPTGLILIHSSMVLKTNSEQLLNQEDVLHSFLSLQNFQLHHCNVKNMQRYLFMFTNICIINL